MQTARRRDEGGIDLAVAYPVPERDTILVLAPPDDQPSDSWVRSLFSVLTRVDFKFGSVPTQGYPLAT